MLSRYGMQVAHPSLPLLTVGVRMCEGNCRVDEAHPSAHDHFGTARDEARAKLPAEQMRHHTFLVAEHAQLTGLTAEMSPACNALLLPEVAWNVAVWRRLAQLEATLGYRFRDKRLLREALTHAAYANEVDGVGLNSGRYERVEWLGDVVLKALASHHLFHALPRNTPERRLAALRGGLVSNRHLRDVGAKLGVAALLLLPERAAASDKMVADVVEALLGSIYLESGWEAARRFFEDFILRDDAARATPAAQWPQPALAPRHAYLRAQLPAAIGRLEARCAVAFTGCKALAQHALLHPSAVPPSPGDMYMYGPHGSRGRGGKGRGGNETGAAWQGGADHVAGRGKGWNTWRRDRGAAGGDGDGDGDGDDGGGAGTCELQFERLEWLGDAVLELIVASELYGRFVDESEFHLTTRLQMLVSNRALVALARRLRIDELVVRDEDAMRALAAARGHDRVAPPNPYSESDGPRLLGVDKWRADAVEAIIAAAFLDAGLGAATQFVRREHMDGWQHPATAELRRLSVEGELHGSAARGAWRVGGGAAGTDDAAARRLAGEGASSSMETTPTTGDAATRAAGGSAGGAAVSKKRRHGEQADDAAAAHGGDPWHRGAPTPLGPALEPTPPSKRPTPPQKHPKSVLQEALTAADMGQATYAMAGREDGGRLTVECRLGGEVMGVGSGHDFKAASTAAAQQVLEVLQQLQGPARTGATDAGYPVGMMAAESAPAATGANGQDHPKARLAQLAQLRPHLGTVAYEVLEDAGPNAPMRYHVGVRLGERLLCSHRGKNHKVASTAAAQQALEILAADGVV